MSFKQLFFIVLFTSICNSSFAQVSVEPIDSTVIKKNIVDKAMSLVEFKFGNTSLSVYPNMGLDPGSGLSVGLIAIATVSPKKTSEYYRPTSLINHVQYSTKRWLNMKSDLLIYTKNGDEIKTYFQYVAAPDKFYGTGQDTRVTPVTYDLKQYKIRGNIAKCMYSRVYTGLVFDISHHTTTSLGPNENGLEIPSQKNPFLFGIGPRIAYDTRDNVNYPSKGSIISSGYLFFPRFAKENYMFQLFEIDARKFVTMYGNIILGMQFFAGFSSGDTPFYYLYQLGGNSRMRGISNKNMYIDYNAMFVQTELRKQIWKRFGGVAFAGYGNSFPTIATFDINKIKYIYGVGIRFQSSVRDKLNLRIDYGRGIYNDSGVYITMREAF